MGFDVDRAAQKTGELLLQGWTLSADTCGEHGTPLMLNKDGDAQCVVCGPQDKEDVSSRISEKLLQGWTMLSATCPRPTCHGAPLMRNKLSEEWCVSCDARVMSEPPKAAQPEQPVGTTIPSIEPQSEFHDNQLHVTMRALQEQLAEATDRLSDRARVMQTAQEIAAIAHAYAECAHAVAALGSHVR